MNRKYQSELEQETDGRWIAEIGALSGAMVYGDTSMPVGVSNPDRNV